MSNWNIEEEKKYYNAYEETHQNVKYLFYQGVYYDDYHILGEKDKVLLNYYELVNFEILDDNVEKFHTLNLTWMNKDDKIAIIPGNKQYEEIKNIIVNIENLENSSLPKKESSQRKINLIVYPGKTKLNIFKQQEIIDIFVAMNWDVINSIVFKGFGPISTKILFGFTERKCSEMNPDYFLEKSFIKK